jgi:hypothetical protein
MGGGHSGYYLAGECDPAVDATPLAITAVELQDPGGCLRETGGFTIVDSVAQWNTAFSCPSPVPVPPGIDLVNGRAAVAGASCAPLSLRFVAESSTEIVVGVLTGISGACVGEPLVVPLQRSAKPVRLAQCASQCDDCPPVP